MSALGVGLGFRAWISGLGSLQGFGFGLGFWARCPPLHQCACAAAIKCSTGSLYLVWICIGFGEVSLQGHQDFASQLIEKPRAPLPHEPYMYRVQNPITPAIYI